MFINTQNNRAWVNCEVRSGKLRRYGASKVPGIYIASWLYTLVYTLPEV